MPAILWPDVEATTLGYLRPRILASPLTFAADVHVGDTLPSPRPDYAVIIRSDGGPAVADVRGTARLGVNIWAKPGVENGVQRYRSECVDLANYVTALLNGMAEANVTPCTRSTATLGYPVADDSGQPHMYLTAELTFRGVNL